MLRSKHSYSNCSKKKDQMFSSTDFSWPAAPFKTSMTSKEILPWCTYMALTTYSVCVAPKIENVTTWLKFSLIVPKFVYSCLPWPSLSSLTKPRANYKRKIYLVQACQFLETWQQKIGGHWKKFGPFCLLPCLPHHFFISSIWPCSTNRNLFEFQKQGVKGTPLPRAQSHL